MAKEAPRAVSADRTYRHLGLEVKRAAVLLVAALITPFLAVPDLFAQKAYDPSDRLYHHLAIWSDQGYLPPLPQLRPYPSHLIGEYLTKIESVGTTVDRALAQGYLHALNFGLRNSPLPRLSADAVVGVASSNTKVGGSLGGRVRSSQLFGERASYTGAFDYWWDSTYQQDFEMLFGPSVYPVMPRAGPDFTVGATTFRGLEDVRLLVAFGRPELYAQAGFAPIAFGSVAHTGGIIIDGHVPPAAQLTLAYRGERLDYAATFLELVALKAVRTTGELYELKTELPTTGFPSKYLALHSVRWNATPWLSVSGFGVSLFGARFSLYTLLPTAFITEPFAGDYDNALAGVAARLRLAHGLAVDAMLYIDDYNFFEGGKFNPSPFANKTAGQLIVTWLPSLPATRLSLAYEYVAPYMYTHSSHQPINYLTYTHYGESLGSPLPPNSERWSLDGMVGLEWSEVTFALRAIRHGNGSDHGTGSVDGDGSIWDDGYGPGGEVTFFGPSTFLTQSVLETTFQLEIAWQVPAIVGTNRFILAGSVSYGFEHVLNPGLDATAAAQTKHVVRFELEASIH